MADGDRRTLRFLFVTVYPQYRVARQATIGERRTCRNDVIRYVIDVDDAVVGFPLDIDRFHLRHR